MTVNFDPILRVLGSRKASDVTAREMLTLLRQVLVLHGVFGDTPGFVAEMLTQCPERNEQLRVMCMRITRLICAVHVSSIDKCLADEYGIGDDREDRSSN
jgi:hypothetical protein